MYCNRHGSNNCIECAIEAQTKAIVEAMRPKSTKKPNIPRPSKPIGPSNEIIKPIFDITERGFQIGLTVVVAFSFGLITGMIIMTN